MERRVLGDYRIIDQIGTSGHKLYYDAAEPKSRLPVILEVHFQPHFDQDSFLRSRQIIRYMTQAGLFSHPNIARVYGIGVIKVGDIPSKRVRLYDCVIRDGVMCLVLENLREGSRLYTGTHPTSLEYVTNILTQICNALAFAHSRGIVNQNLTPAHILVTDKGIVKITNFSIEVVTAEVFGLPVTSAASTEALIPVPRYISPEQIRDEQIAWPTDIFYLGIILYEMLTGDHHHPFYRDRMNLDQYFSAVLYESPIPPRQYNNWIPVELEDIVYRALNKKPTARPSASAILKMLERK